MEAKIVDRLNISVLISSLALLTVGLIAIYSATYGNLQVETNFTKQLAAALSGVVIVTIIIFTPPKFIQLTSYIFYGLTILMLVLVLFLGKKISGQTSWFSIGGFGIQPSEFAKVTTVIALSNFLSGKFAEADVTKPRDFFIALFIGLFPVLLIMLQPDMGTSLVFLVFMLTILYWAGMPNFVLFFILAPGLTAIGAFLGKYYFVLAVLIVLGGLIFFKRNLLISTVILCITIFSGISVSYVYNKLQPYQQKRIMNLFTPENDALGSGYNVIQAKIAIGSGGVFGKGFLQGTQTQLKYIPEQWTDFIFCMVGEEFGFIGSIIVVILFLVLIIQTIHIAYLCKNKFLSICCIGFATIISFHMLVNMGMTMGIMPVIGIPLPFMSYGVSFLLSNMIMLGIILNAYRNRKEYV
jgi:rod shape determining protein RodA